MITITPTPVATAPADITACNDDMIAAIALMSDVSGTTFDVTSSVDVGFGTNLEDVMEIAAFTADNTSGEPVTATVTVTPTFTDNNTSCEGDAVTFDITVNPTPTFGTISSTDDDDAVCNNEFIGFGVTGLLPNVMTTISYTINGQPGPDSPITVMSDDDGNYDFPPSDQYGVGEYTVVITEVSVAGCSRRPKSRTLPSSSGTAPPDAHGNSCQPRQRRGL